MSDPKIEPMSRSQHLLMLEFGDRATSTIPAWSGAGSSRSCSGLSCS
jgi:hypothetical protein